MNIKELNERLNRIQDYEEALMKIEMLGHSDGHGRGYTCANIAEEALRKHLWKPEAVSKDAYISQQDADRVVKEYLDLNAYSGFIPIDLDVITETIWESTVDDGMYKCKVKRIAEREGILTVLNVTTQKTLLRTPVELAYGASFGPDVHDVAYWEELCINAIDVPA